MGDVISLDSRRPGRLSRKPARAHCFVDLADPFSYLVAERIHRAFASVSWRLACKAAVERRDPAADPFGTEAEWVRAERRAMELRMPLEWPDRYPCEVPAAMRAASLAIETGRGAEFVLAAGRLAFCGGFDLEDPEILAEAAAAAGLGLDDCLAAARDPRRDEPTEAASRRLLAVGAECLPVARIGRTLLWGEERISAHLAGTGRAVTAS